MGVSEFRVVIRPKRASPPTKVPMFVPNEGPALQQPPCSFASFRRLTRPSCLRPNSILELLLPALLPYCLMRGPVPRSDTGIFTIEIVALVLLTRGWPTLETPCGMVGKPGLSHTNVLMSRLGLGSHGATDLEKGDSALAAEQVAPPHDVPFILLSLNNQEFP